MNILPLKISSFSDEQFETIKWYDIFIGNLWSSISKNLLSGGKKDSKVI